MQAIVIQVESEGEKVVVATKPNIRSNIEVVKLPTFNREMNRVFRFLIVCRLYIRIEIRDVLVEEQV